MLLYEILTSNLCPKTGLQKAEFFDYISKGNDSAKLLCCIS